MISKFFNFKNSLLILIFMSLFTGCPHSTIENKEDGYVVNFANIPSGYTLVVYKSQDVADDANIQESFRGNCYVALQQDGSAAKKRWYRPIEFHINP